jgi:hypothetical protein
LDTLLTAQQQQQLSQGRQAAQIHYVAQLIRRQLLVFFQASIMSTTLVATGGKGSNPKTSLYVGGLAENVNEEILQAAFLPFGNLKDINIPLDHATGKHRGAARQPHQQ